MVNDKYFNVDIDDPRAGAIAEVMSNKTAKKILSLIAEKELSESDIASELSLPLNTVGYNINKLLKAGLIEKSKTFFWSVKGKKIPTYKLSNKKIVISPKRLISAPTVMIASILGAILIIALLLTLGNNNNLIIGNNQSSGNGIDDKLNQFSSYEELDSFLKNRTDSINNNNYNINIGFGEEMAVATADARSLKAGGATGGSADSYSETNVQVEGVDEPDFVKNDGKYIYTVSGNKIVIVDAYPAEQMRSISEINVSGVQNIFVNEDKLIVFMPGYETYYANDLIGGIAEKMIAPCYGYGCGGYSQSKTQVLVYDISDRKNPTLEGNYSFDGNYVDARMIGDNIYLVSQQYLYNYGVPRPVYSVDGIEKAVNIDEIYYSDEYDESFVFTYVNAVDLKEKNVEVKVYLIGASGTIYVSENNIYLTSQKWLSYDKQTEILIKEGIIPLMPNSYKNQINEIWESGNYSYEKQQMIMKLVYKYAASLGNGDEGSDFNKKLAESMERTQVKISKEHQKTVIHRIEVDGLDIEYKSAGEVPGYLLNQFSLDEYQGNLRVAVTTGSWGGNTLNHLYVLDDSLEIIGSVEDLAQGERIYSSRFIGDRVYMVTFRQVDPLYVIDLSKPDKPEVLGYLKVTGYSSYLHPYDKDTIIGIGMDADEQGRVSGVKVALFDVSDVSNPVEKAKYAIKSEGQWTWSSSEALYEHKAFLFDKEKNLLAIPIQYSYYSGDRYRQWNGAYVFYIDENSIELKGKVTHVEEYKPKYGPAKDELIVAERKDYSGSTWTKTGEDEWNGSYDPKVLVGVSSRDYSEYVGSYGTQNNEWIDQLPGGVDYAPYDYDWQKRIQRSLFMDNVLYTISQSVIKANDIDDLNEISKLELGYAEYYYPGPILY